ncbi:hypothetical protein [Halobacteriovorax sp. HLS]|uniref:hypothetical protein n=1 Tax=Halobacteriovorax sp. HLS TaxID=2234000 RepID=UPI000FD8DB64|nr:hypothetical protein [Halobacteriovorax sp. HLS]
MKKNIFIILSSLFISCSEQGTNEAAQFVRINLEEIEKIELSFIKEKILMPKCISCHGWISDDSKILSRVVAGEPESSMLYRRTNDGTMPFGGPPLTKDEVTLIYKYIKDLE